MSDNVPVLGTVDIKIVSLNVLAPCYNRVECEQRKVSEEDFQQTFLSRHDAICDALIATNADIICLQEFWVENEDIQDLYKRRMCEESGYTMKQLRRTSHWRQREDGLAILVKEENVEIQDSRDILFHDCGDRVALLLLLAAKPKIQGAVPQQFIVINTHLLFPHNPYSTNIRLREATKILGFCELYRQRELCTTICNRADVRLPVIVTGDFNGSPKGAVHKFFLSQNFHSAMEERMLQEGKENWVTHKSHRQQLVPVDHVFYCNPSEQTFENLPPVPDWTDLVFREVFQKIVERYGVDKMRDAFGDFGTTDQAFIDRALFKNALTKLGFTGEGQPALTSEEIEVLADSADVDGNGKIDFKEFVDRFWLAQNNEDLKSPIKQYFLRSQWLNQDTEETELDFEFILPPGGSSVSLISPEAAATVGGNFIERSVPNSKAQSSLLPILRTSRPLGDLTLVEGRIFPPELEKGEWPESYRISDHGIVEVVFRASVLAAIPEEESINPMPVASKKRTSA